MQPSSEIDGAERLSLMSEKETLDLFNNSLREAASIAYQMAELQQNPIWADIAQILKYLCMQGMQLANGKAMSRTDVLQSLEQREIALGIKHDANAKIIH